LELWHYHCKTKLNKFKFTSGLKDKVRVKNILTAGFLLLAPLLGLASSVLRCEDMDVRVLGAASRSELPDRVLRQEKWGGYKEHIIERQQLSPVRLGDIDYFLYKKANLSINVTHACNALCGFCVDALRKKVDSEVHTNVESDSTLHRKSESQIYLDHLEEQLKAIKDTDVSVSVTGGEPTLDSARLGGILKLLKKYNIKKRVVTTNGSLLLSPSKRKTNERVVDVIVESGIEHLNISRAHFDENENSAIMNMPKFTNVDLKKVVAIANKTGIRVRLSVALLKEGIYDVDGIKKYLDWAKSIGVDNVTFRQLMDFDINSMEPNWVTEFYRKEGSTIKLDDIFPQLEQDMDFKMVKQHPGYYYYVEIYKYQDMDVTFEVADLTLLDNQNIRKPIYEGRPIIYEMIMQPNGNIESTWQPNADILVPGPTPSIKKFKGIPIKPE
jgi:molybdenum cofactor biosynthesis enzyme MoaA